MHPSMKSKFLFCLLISRKPRLSSEHLKGRLPSVLDLLGLLDTHKLEIVMNEIRKLKMSAVFLQIHPMIFVDIQECKVLLYIGGM